MRHGNKKMLTAKAVKMVFRSPHHFPFTFHSLLQDSNQEGRKKEKKGKEGKKEGKKECKSVFHAEITIHSSTQLLSHPFPE